MNTGKSIEKQVGWTTTTGLAVTVTATMQLSKISYCDGDRVEIPCHERHLSADVQGMGQVGVSLNLKCESQTINGRVLVAHIGKLGLTAEQLAMVQGIISELDATPEWMEYETKIAANRAANDARNAADRRSGLCPRCHTWCYGDCRS